MREENKKLILENKRAKQGEAKIVRRIVFVIALIGLLAIAGVVGGGYRYVTTSLEPVNPENTQEKEIEIPIGSSATSIGLILEENNIIKSARIFRYYVKLNNESGFQAGSYQLTEAMELDEIISKLKEGRVIKEVVFKMTIPEGRQLQQIAEIIAGKTEEKKEDIIKQLDDPEFIEILRGKYPDILTDEILAGDIMHPLEGYLFPATYPFYKENPTLEEIVEVMLDKTREISKTYAGKMEEMDYTLHTMLTMASLIEEEATQQVEREKISSVFYNRMDINMPLQTDPTVLYALGEHKDRTLYEDLEVDSPYNTYKNQGLPPGPIANAGVISIEAALNPAETDYLYFLATSTGEVIFTKTLDAHNREKAKHITNKK